MAPSPIVRLLALVVAATVVMTASGQDTNSVKDLITQLKDKDEGVRLKAAKELGKLKEKAKEAVPALTVAADRDSDEDVRAVTKKSLEAIKDALVAGEKEKMREVLDPLLKDLKGKDAEKRVAALDKLADLGTRAKEAGADVVEFGLLAPSPAIRDAATAALEKIDPDAHKLIVTVLFDKDERNKLSAISGLGSLAKKGKSSLPALKYYYVQKVTHERSGGYYAGTALQAMVKIAPDDKGVIETVVAVVLKPLQHNPMLPERSLAIALVPSVKLETKRKVKTLIDALPDPVTRAQAVTLLGKMGPDAKEAVSVLTKLKLDPDRAVREAAGKALDQIKE